MASTDSEKGNEENVEKIVRRYLDWLDSEIDIQWTYHNHKETTAWVATAAYISAILFLFNETPAFTTWYGKSIVSLILFLLVYAVYVFVNMQFQMRWEGADTSRGLRRAKTKLCLITTKAQIEEFSKDFAPWDFDPWLEAKRKPSEKAIQYPKFITDEIKKAKTHKQNLTEIMKELSSTPKDDTPFMWPPTLININARTRSELASYSALAIVTLTFLIKVWGA